MKRHTIWALAALVAILGSCWQPTGSDDGIAGGPDGPAPDVTTGLVAYYPFSGDAGDASGNGNDGSVSNATLATDRHGATGSAYLFNGTDSRITVSAPSGSSLNDPAGALSMAAWIELDGYSTNGAPSQPFGPILMKSSSTSNGFMYRMLVSGTGLSIAVSDWNSGVGTAYTFSADPTGETWYHVASTWDGVTARFYVNGVLVDESGYTVTMTADTRDLVIGADPPGAPESFNGRIDEVRIYDRALTADQVGALANQ